VDRWAQRCRIAQFVRLARRIREHRCAIVATIEHGLTSAVVESFNTKIRLITRRAFGFHNEAALIALARFRSAVSARNYPLERQKSPFLSRRACDSNDVWDSRSEFSVWVVP
jgi:hypothetical protein